MNATQLTRDFGFCIPVYSSIYFSIMKIDFESVISRELPKSVLQMLGWLGQMKFPRQTAKHLLCFIFLSLAWSDTGATLLCRLASLQEMTHGHLSFIMCGLVAALVVTAMRSSCLVLSSWKTYTAPALRQSGCRAAMFYLCLFFNHSLFNMIFLYTICQNLFQCLQDLWILEETNHSCFPFRRRSDLWHFILSPDSKAL